MTKIPQREVKKGLIPFRIKARGPRFLARCFFILNGAADEPFYHRGCTKMYWLPDL